MGVSQEETFESSEGDQWFERNREALDRFDPEADFPLRLIELYHLRPRNVLEVGAANGVRLAAIHQRFAARVVGVEPSVQAINDGVGKFPFVTFVRGTAYAIPQEELFDLIIINFVFHWVDRINFLRSIAEIDRLLIDRGFLIIGDFHPSNTVKVRYHHLAEHSVYTYKQSYAATFLASGLYHPISLITGGYASRILTGEVGEDERIGVWLLQKTLQDHYIERPFLLGERGGVSERTA